MEIDGKVMISISDYELLKSKINELEELKVKIEGLYENKYSDLETKKIQIDEYKILEFISEYLNIDKDPIDICVENYKINVEWNESIPF